MHCLCIYFRGSCKHPYLHTVCVKASHCTQIVHWNRWKRSSSSEQKKTCFGWGFFLSVFCCIEIMVDMCLSIESIHFDTHAEKRWRGTFRCRKKRLNAKFNDFQFFFSSLRRSFVAYIRFPSFTLRCSFFQ